MIEGYLLRELELLLPYFIIETIFETSDGLIKFRFVNRLTGEVVECNLHLFEIESRSDIVNLLIETLNRQKKQIDRELKISTII